MAPARSPPTAARDRQPQLVNGSWGALELPHAGQKQKVPAKGVMPNVKDGKIQ